MTTPLTFKFGLPLLNREGALILNAYKTNHAPMDARLGATFYDDAVTEKKTLFGDTDPIDPSDPSAPPGTDPGGSSSAQAHAKADFSDLTEAQDAALGQLELLVAAARKIAKRAFKGDATKLHDDYQVGEHESRTLPDVLDRANKVASSCQNDVAAMQAKGWGAADTAKLRSAIQVLGGSDTSQVSGLEDQKKATGVKNQQANQFYETLLTIQAAANAEWLEGTGADDIRAAFRLGFFPPHEPKRKPRPKSEDAKKDGGTAGGGGK
jgi:hypothetical protein